MTETDFTCKKCGKDHDEEFMKSDGANATTSDEYGASTLAQAQAKASDRLEEAHYEREKDYHKFAAKLTALGLTGQEIERQWLHGRTRRCIFHHSVPANQGFEIKAGFVCFQHSGEFDSAGS